jgi:hypothetical protein
MSGKESFRFQVGKWFPEILFWNIIHSPMAIFNIAVIINVKQNMFLEFNVNILHQNPLIESFVEFKC